MYDLLCAVASPAWQERLPQETLQTADWERVIHTAEHHGLAPLLYTRLRDASAPLPASAKRALHALYLRHTYAARVRARVLAEIIAACDAAGIEPLVLKGAALAHLVYPSPELRPMRDIDLLVRESDAPRARSLLAQCGFSPPTSGGGVPVGHHHLASVERVVEGVTVSVEVHHALNLNEPRRPPRRWGDYRVERMPFGVNGAGAYTLSRAETLWHVYRHAFCMPLGYEPLRLIWVADLANLVERWVDDMDWQAIRRVYPAVWNALPLLHALTPWSERVQARLGFDARHAREDAEAILSQWPLFVPSAAWHKDAPRILRHIVCPPSWWARVRYGERADRAGGWRAWAKHQWTAWTQAARFLMSER